MFSQSQSLIEFVPAIPFLLSLKSPSISLVAIVVCVLVLVVHVLWIVAVIEIQ
jgi:hypothetical protein